MLNPMLNMALLLVQFLALTGVLNQVLKGALFLALKGALFLALNGVQFLALNGAQFLALLAPNLAPNFFFDAKNIMNSSIPINSVDLFKTFKKNTLKVNLEGKKE
jgi:hypothetical protein